MARIKNKMAWGLVGALSLLVVAIVAGWVLGSDAIRSPVAFSSAVPCFVTGGGAIDPDGNGADHWGGNAGPMRDGSIRGRLSHQTRDGDHLQGSAEWLRCRKDAGDPGMPPALGTYADWGGTGSWNGDDGYTFRVHGEDRGEPATRDYYSIMVFGPDGGFVYFAGGTVTGGNFQIHPPNDGHPIYIYVDSEYIDSELDAVPDAVEVDVYNTDPLNPDTDFDGVQDGWEVLVHGTDPNNPDADGDLVSDGPADPDGGGPIVTGPDNCPLVDNPLQENSDEALAAGGAWVTGDALGDACDDNDDNDGYTDFAEASIGTDADDNCTNTAGPGPGPNIDAWPSDMNLSDSVNLTDISGPFKPHFGTVQGVDPTGTNPGDYNPRVDLNLSGSINLQDISGPYKPDFGKSCS